MWPSWRKFHHLGTHLWRRCCGFCPLLFLFCVPHVALRTAACSKNSRIYLKRNFQGCETKPNLLSLWVSQLSLAFHDIMENWLLQLIATSPLQNSKDSSSSTCSLVKVATYGILYILLLCKLLTCRTKLDGTLLLNHGYSQRLGRDLTVPIIVGVSFIKGKHGWHTHRIRFRSYWRERLWEEETPPNCLKYELDYHFFSTKAYMWQPPGLEHICVWSYLTTLYLACGLWNLKCSLL